VIARFEAERQALALMDHPSIAKVFDAGSTETGRPYFVMELVQGVSITDYCDKNNLCTKDRLHLFLQVCQAVQHAHTKGIIHRDIKPSNVMVTNHDGEALPKVIDFGIAKATNQKLTEKTLFTRYAHLIGTPAYMSPEQAELSDLDIDTRSDIYSLGVLLYELLTGTTPFSEEELRKAGYVEMQRVIREQEPVKPSTKLSTLGDTLTDIAKCRSATPDLLRKAIRGDLDWIVMKSLEKDRVRRYDCSSAFLADVKRYLDQEPVLAGPPTTWYRTKKFLQRHRVLVSVAAFVTATVLAALGVSTASYLRAERARAGEAVARAEAQAVTDFLTKDLLASVYPEKARNREVTARYLLESASRDLEGKFARSPLAEARVRETLGLTYQKMGDYAAAGPHLERALVIRRAQLGEEHPATLASLNQLGLLFTTWGRYSKAESLLLRAFEVRKRVLGEEDPDTLESMSDLGWQYMCEARFEEGMALAARVLEVGRRVLEEEDPIMLRATNSLATGYVTLQRYAEARSLADRGYEISRRVLGEEHETTLLLVQVSPFLRGSLRKKKSRPPCRKLGQQGCI
ncbi:MAG: serine/threonine protein kinase, partial [Planctomycetes bacterium]|nr:serine/threonine protein kinase [Planctomycetota bacterium]